MAYEVRYKLEFINNAEQTCVFDIYEDNTGDPIDFSYVEGSDSPVIIRSIDNDRSLFTPIMAHEASVEIVTDTLSLLTFMSDNDQKWKGIFTVAGEEVFSGFLIQEDSSEDFVTYKRRINLKFTDGLGVLKEVRLSDSSGLPWHATPTIYTILKTCLAKTGQSLPIRVRCNIFPADTSDVTLNAAFAINKLYTRSFMVDERDFDFCYNVISDIMLAFGCILYQHNGQWVIDRVADRCEGSTRDYTYSTADVLTYNGTTYEIAAIGETEYIKEVQNPLLLSYTRTSLENKVKYYFRPWPEIVRNLDLDEGDINIPLGGPTYTIWDLDYWTQTSRTAYIRRDADTNGTETQRFIVIEGAANNLDQDKYIKPETYPAIAGDQLELSFQVSSKTDINGGSAVVYVKCGSYWLDDDGKWYTATKSIVVYFANADDSTIWKDFSIKSEAFPANGDVEVRFALITGCGVGNETRYKDIRINNIAITGNSGAAKGDFNRFTNSVTKKNPVDFEVRVSDSIRKVTVGALLKNNGEVESGWQRGSNAESLRFSQLNAFGYYQTTYRSKMTLDGSFLGAFTTVPVGFWQTFTVADAANKQFMLASMDEINWMTGIWSGRLIEIRDTVLDDEINVVGTNYEYNYIFDRG